MNVCGPRNFRKPTKGCAKQGLLHRREESASGCLRNSNWTEKKEDAQLWNQNFTKVSSLTWSDEILTFRRNNIKNFSRLNYCMLFFLLLHLLNLHWQILELHLLFAQFYWSTIDISQYFSQKCQISLFFKKRSFDQNLSYFPSFFQWSCCTLFNLWIATDSFISSWLVFFFFFSFITILFHNLISLLDSSERFRLLELDKLFKLNNYLN